MRSKSFGVGFLLFGIAALGWVILNWVKYHDETTRRRAELITLCHHQSVDALESAIKVGATIDVEKFLQEEYKNCLDLHGVKLPARTK